MGAQLDRLNPRIQDHLFLRFGGRFSVTTNSEDGEFNRAVGVCVDANGHICVADRGNDRVQQFDSHGRYAHKFLDDAVSVKMSTRYIGARECFVYERWRS